jgi:regulator of sirC expression with transglutaminase-like and TPR domain
MLDVVLERRLGLPILLSVVYAEVARRAGIPLAGVGLPGHFVCGRFGDGEPVLLDPFRGGVRVGYGGPAAHVRPWVPREIALRMLNNLVAAHARRGDLPGAVRAAELRLPLAGDEEEHAMLDGEFRVLRARLG